MEANRHFTVIVVGENHAALMEPYDRNKEVKPYVVLEYKKAGDYRQRYINYVTEGINSGLIKDKKQLQAFKSAKEHYEAMTDDDFYLEISAKYDIDEKTGDAISYNNPDGLYDSANIAGRFALPLKTKDGKEVYSAKKGDVDWSQMHLNDTKVYEIAWDVVMDGVEPKDDYEKGIYENMKNRTAYFERFGNKRNYVASCTAFWGYAYVDKDGWKELQDDEDQFTWVTNFYSRFIEPLGDNEQVTVYECLRK